MDTDNLQLNAVRARIALAMDALRPWHKQFPDDIDAFGELLADLHKKWSRLAGDARLNIGIMGQVKAGKSSFLNALLFDGKPVLPEAATPKTANLTRIGWGAIPTLTVTFYSREEWAQIEKSAASESQGTEAIVARDLVVRAKANGVDIGKTPKAGTLTKEADSIDGLIELMNDYVGEDGTYTPLVQMTELALPDEALKGYEIVDTPGMNDPVPSRTDKTRQFMADCDVAIFLSRCSQFLDQSDMELLGRHLPTKGVKRLALVAGQMDGAIIDDGFDRRSLAATEANIRSRLSARADKEMSVHVARQKEARNTALADVYERLRTPIFSSTYAHLFATWPANAWRQHKGMSTAYDAIADIANDSWGSDAPSASDWERIANFAEIRAMYDAARQDKDALLDFQRKHLVDDIATRFVQCVETIGASAAAEEETLRNADLETFRAQRKTCEAAIARIAKRLGDIFDATTRKAREQLNDISAAHLGAASKGKKLQLRQGTEMETRSRTVSTSVWYKIWTWGSEETVYYKVPKNYEYLATADAIEKLAEFAREKSEELTSTFNDIVSMERLRNQLHDALMKSLDTASTDFDPTLLRDVLPRTLNRIKLPDPVFDIGDIRRHISSRFSSEVRGDQMDELQQAVKNSLAEIAARLSDEATRKVEALCKSLDRAHDNLGQTMTEALTQRLARLEASVAEKEKELRSLEALLKTVEGMSENRWSRAA